MPVSPRRRRVLVALVVATFLPLALTSCGVVETLQGAGDQLKRQIGEALGGQDESVSDEGDTSIELFATGDCLDDAAVDLNAAAVASLDSADCNDPHDSEVIGLEALEGAAYPGDEQVVGLAESLCSERFEEWTGGTYDEQPELEFGYYMPTESGWLTGDTNLMCIVFASGQITGTTKDAAATGTTLKIGEPTAFPGWVASDEGNTEIGELAVGQCIDDGAVSEDPTIDEVRSVDVVECAAPHDSEVLGVTTISGEAYMSDDDDLYADAIHSACVPLFEAWTGGSYDAVIHLDYFFYVVPTVKSRLASYEGVCTIYNPDGQLTGSTQGAAIVGA